MLYTPITIEQYLEENLQILAEVEKQTMGFTELEAARIEGRLDMLKTVIEDLKVILAGPVEIP